METTLVDIDSLCNTCGYLNHVTVLNNGYGCDNKGCGEGEYVKIIKEDPYGNIDEYLEIDDRLYLAKKMVKRIRKNRRFIKKLKKRIKKVLSDKSELEKYGIKWQSKCYASSCPLGNKADRQDFIEHGEDPEYMTEGHWVVIPIETYKKLFKEKWLK